ncbi:MAG: carbohydrate kinase family protein [Gaiellaceae bacterium]
MLVCTLGDQTLDVVVRLSGPLAAGGDTNAEIHVGPGGQAANVAAWAAALGATARSIGKRGADDAGRLVRRGLEARGVEVLGPEEGRNGVICSLVSADGTRSMAADRSAGAELGPDEIDETWLDGCDHLFVSGYALLREPARAAAHRAGMLARDRGASVSVDLSTWSAIREAGPDEMRTTIARLAPDLVFANADEERIVGGPIAGPTWISKRGPEGASFGGDVRAALPVERVVDSTGAGDALAAGFIVGGPDLALEAAARCVSRLGSMP